MDTLTELIRQLIQFCLDVGATLMLLFIVGAPFGLYNSFLLKLLLVVVAGSAGFFIMTVIIGLGEQLASGMMNRYGWFWDLDWNPEELRHRGRARIKAAVVGIGVVAFSLILVYFLIPSLIG